MLSESGTKKVEFIIKAVYFAIIAVIVYAAYHFVGIIIPFVLAFLLVAALQPLIRLINKKLGVNKKLLSGVFITIVYIGAGAILFWLILQLFFLLKDSLPSLPDYFRDHIEPMLSNSGNGVSDWLTNVFPEWQSFFDSTHDSLTNGLRDAVGTISQKGVSLLGSLISGLPGFFIGLLFTIIASFLIGNHYDVLMRFLKNQVPEKMAASFSGIRTILKNTVWKYIKAMSILTVITFVEVIIGLLIIGAPHPVLFAALIAFFDLLPVFGPGAIMIPWFVIELMLGSTGLAIGIAVIYVIITIIRRVTEPKIVGNQLGLHPILSLLAIYVGYRLFGFLGMIVLPIAVQVLLVMHKKGNIRLFKEKKDGQAEEQKADD